MSTLTISFKGKVLKRIPLRKGEQVIGKDPQCGIYIDSLALQDHHASITTEAGVSVLRDLNSTSGTFVNGTRVEGEYTLKNRDNIHVGKHSLLFEEDLGPGVADDDEIAFTQLAASGPAKNAWLQIMSGSNVGKTISLSRNLTNLGKTGVQTAVIARRNDGFFLSHLEGEKTPLVNDRPIGDKTHQLEDGDIIQMGNVKMQFYLQ